MRSGSWQSACFGQRTLVGWTAAPNFDRATFGASGCKLSTEFPIPQLRIVQPRRVNDQVRIPSRRAKARLVSDQLNKKPHTSVRSSGRYPDRDGKMAAFVLIATLMWFGAISIGLAYLCCV